MAETEVVVLCYWDCGIKHGPDGVYFEGSPPKEMRVKKKTDFSSFLDELYLITGFDKQKSKLQIVYRCPVAQSPNRFRYQLYPVMCDGHLETMLELPSNHSFINSVELFLELKPIPGRVIDLRDPVENPRKKSKRTQQEVKDEEQAGVVSGLWVEDNAMRSCYPESSDDFEVERLEYEIERLVKVHPLLSISELVKWWKEKFGYELTDTDQVDDAEGVLQKAKEKALKRVYGGWEQSFSFTPKLMSALHSSNGLVVDWQHDSSLPDPEHALFRGVFWAFPQSIQGFQHCRPVIVVDTKDLGGKYKMKLMIASGIDAVNEHFPLAFAVTKEVSVNCWRWFLSRIREKVTQRKGLCLISSPHPDILSVVNEPESQWKEPWAYHVFCLNHLSSQIRDVFEDRSLSSLVDKAGSTIKKEEFDSYMKEMKEKNLEAWKWLDRFPPHQWALSHDSGRRRYGIMKFNTRALFAVCERFPKVAMVGGVMLQFGEMRDAFEESFSRSRCALNRV